MTETEDLLGSFDFFSTSIKAYEKAIKYYYIFADSKHYKRYNVLYVSHDNNVFGFGYNSFGVLGLAHDKKVKMPTEIYELSFRDINEFHNGKKFVLAIDHNKKIIHAMGEIKIDEPNPTEFVKFKKATVIKSFYPKIGEIILQVSCGYNHALILIKLNKTDREVYGWGSNKYGQIAQVTF